MRMLVILVLVSALTVPAQSSDAAFYRPVRDNDLPALQAIIRKSGASVQDSRGSTALMYAAAIGSLEAMKLLVDAGAQVNASNSFGATALMWCAGDIEKVRYLLDKGASVTAKAKTGRTPLFIAAMYDGSVQIARLMIAKGADVRATEQSGASIVAAAAGANNLELVRLLLEKGADPNVKDGAGFTALSQATGSGARSAPLVKLLLDRRVAVDPVCIDSVEMMKNGPIGIGRLTPLHLAVGQGNYSTVELLVNAGANVNAADIRGMTPLMIAIATDRADARIVRLLLSKGADPKKKSVKGETALDWARKYRVPEIQQALGLKQEQMVEPAIPATAKVSTREAMERSVALLQRTSHDFLRKAGCPACHSQHQTGMAVAAAKASGAKVDWDLEQSEVKAMSSLRGSLSQTLFQVIDPPPGTDGHVFSMLQINAAGLQPSLATDSLIFHLAAMQRNEGDWPNYGMVRPPVEDGSFTITAKAIKALRDNMFAGRKREFQERINRAADWLAKASPLTTEDRTMQLLGLRWAGRTVPTERVKELVALQRTNGGWGQTENLQADAYATGEVLYALHESGMAPTNASYKRGVEYLLRTQHAAGSWLVKTRAAGFQPYFESGFPHGHDQWISQSGTAWAVIALSFAGR